MYFHPLDGSTEAALQEKWREATTGEQPATVADTQIEVMFGRTLQVMLQSDLQHHGSQAC